MTRDTTYGIFAPLLAGVFAFAWPFGSLLRLGEPETFDVIARVMQCSWLEINILMTTCAPKMRGK